MNNTVWSWPRFIRWVGDISQINELMTRWHSMGVWQTPNADDLIAIIDDKVHTKTAIDSDATSEEILSGEETGGPVQASDSQAQRPAAKRMKLPESPSFRRRRDDR